MQRHGYYSRPVHAVLEALRRRVPQRARRVLWRSRLVRSVAERVLTAEPYEPELGAALEALVAPGSLCVDVGAHHGLVTIPLARLTGPTGRVIAFEAHPDNAETLRRTVAAEGLADRVTVENRAITDGRTARISLHSGRRDASAEWNVVGVDVEGRATPARLEVDATSLDAFFDTEGFQPAVVKIDVEGAERQVFEGMRRLLKQARPALAIEFHNDDGWAGRSELTQAGYALYTTDGIRLEQDAERVYHCLALPRERSLPQGLAG